MNHKSFAWSLSVLAFSVAAALGERDARADETAGAEAHDIKLEPSGSAANEAELRCTLRMPWREDALRCLGRGSYATSTNIHLGMDLAGYHDTVPTDVVGPAWLFSFESPGAGVGVGGSFAIDVVSRASSDIVATASPVWREVRYEPALYAHKTFGKLGDLGIHGNLSIAPGNLGKHIGASYVIELANKRIIPSAGYDFGHDDTGLYGTPLSAFNHVTFTHGIAAAVSLALGDATTLALRADARFARSDTSKPYRYIDPETMPNIDIVQRPPAVGPRDLLPPARQGYSVAGTLLHRFSSSIFRMDMRPYADSWGVKALTSELSYYLDITDRFRIWPTVQFNVQTSSDFWQRVYTVPVDTDTAPAYRTTNSELGAHIEGAGALAMRFAFGDKRSWALLVHGSAAYKRYLNNLYINERITLLGTTTLSVDLQ